MLKSKGVLYLWVTSAAQIDFIAKTEFRNAARLISTRAFLPAWH
jgi:hypothetical protein